MVVAVTTIRLVPVQELAVVSIAAAFLGAHVLEAITAVVTFAFAVEAGVRLGANAYAVANFNVFDF